MTVTDGLYPLSDNEIIYKAMFFRYPDLHFDQPYLLEELNDVTRKLPEFHQIIRRDQTSFPMTSVFNEGPFQEHTSVNTRMHERFSPCFYHEHSFFEIIYVIAGKGIHYIGEKAQTINEGDICIIAPHTRHAISVFDEDTLVLNILLRSSTFQQTFFSALQEKGILSEFFSRALFTPDRSSHLLFHAGKDEVLMNLVNEIITETEGRKRFAGSICNSLVTLFFLYLLRRHEECLEVPNPAGGQNDRNIILILNYLMCHYTEISLTELAEFFNYSERQMTRLLKDYTGESFTSFIRNVRMEKACEMLRSTEIAIPDIIASVGYTNATHFYQLFKKRYGLTPAAYREQHR